ncbi:MAG: hypothetical protein FWG53_06320 [Clostridiales bacterium]|nr:hypothetical protein [Clostridiales bacterium]
MSSLVSWKGHRCYVHVYYDSLKAEMENRKFDRLLYACRQELSSGELRDGHKAHCEKFFTVKETPKRGQKVEYRQEAIGKHRESTSR